MLRQSPPLLGHGSRYLDRFCQYPYRRSRPRHLMPQWAHRKSPIAHKQPEHYKDTWDSRAGLDWHNRLRHRGIYRHWPWVRWTDDFLRQHKEVDPCARTFSTKAKSHGGQVPLWDHYKEVGELYELPVTVPVASLTDVMQKYVGKTWSRGEMEGYFAALAAAGWATIEAVNENAAAVTEWNRMDHAVPTSFVQHTLLLARDVCRQAQLKAHRVKLHESGVLRTREMERYYALPHLQGPAMPTTLARMSGTYPRGRYLTMIDSPFHPLQFPDRLGAENRYPA